MTPIMPPLMERLDLAMSHGRYNRSTLSKALNLSRTAAQNWFNPKVVTQPNKKKLKEVARLCHCSEKWLIYGEGEMTEESLSVEEMLTEIARLKKIIEELQAKNARLVSNNSVIAGLIKTQDAKLR